MEHKTNPYGDPEWDRCEESTELWLGNVRVDGMRCSLERGHPYDPQAVDPLLHEAYNENGDLLASWATGVVFHAQFEGVTEFDGVESPAAGSAD